MRLLLRATLFAAALLAGTQASLADCGEGLFRGFYIGGTLGYGHQRAEQSAQGEPDVSATDDGFVGGGHLGYNIQCGRVVAGIETDINIAHFKSNSSWPDPIFLTSKIDGFGTLRGRLGLTLDDRLLMFATAGLAYADVSQKLRDPAPPFGAPAFSQTDSDWKTGWVAGAGLEYLVTDNWMVRGEFLHVDLGTNSRTYQFTAGCVACQGTARWDDSFWVGRIGVSYKFGAPVAAYVPLK